MRGASASSRGHTERLIGAAHFKLYRPYHGQAWWYLHAFNSFSASPPFELLASSRPFVLPGPFGIPYRDRIQFAAGLALVEPRDGAEPQFVLTYGVGDCTALAVRLPRDFVIQEAADKDELDGFIISATSEAVRG